MVVDSSTHSTFKVGYVSNDACKVTDETIAGSSRVYMMEHPLIAPQ